MHVRKETYMCDRRHSCVQRDADTPPRGTTHASKEIYKRDLQKRHTCARWDVRVGLEMLPLRPKVRHMRQKKSVKETCKRDINVRKETYMCDRKCSHCAPRYDTCVKKIRKRDLQKRHKCAKRDVHVWQEMLPLRPEVRHMKRNP